MTHEAPATRPLVIAHRGASHAAPENTLAAFRLAWQLGADGIEGDFRLTRDGRIVCIHDADLKRTAGVSLRVEQSTLDELRRHDVGAWKGSQWAGERIATLDEVLATVPRGKKLFIEIKSGPAIVPALRASLAGARLEPEQLRIIAFEPDVVQAVKAALPDYKVCLLVSYRQESPEKGWSPTPDEILRALEATRADGLGTEANTAAFDRELADRLHAAGRELHVWTVNDIATADYFRALGARSLTTDHPDMLLEHVMRIRGQENDDT